MSGVRELPEVFHCSILADRKHYKILTYSSPHRQLYRQSLKGPSAGKTGNHQHLLAMNRNRSRDGLTLSIP